MNNYLWKAIPLVVSFCFSSLAAAGPHVVGNGGVSVVCRDPQTREITSAELLDLFEAENLGIPIHRSEAPVNQQLDAAFGRLAKTRGVSVELRRQLHQLQGQVQFLQDPAVGLPPIDDAFPLLLKKGCNFEQLAIYNSEEGRLTIDGEIYNSPHFSRTDAAALWTHEAIYRLDRHYYGSTNSLASRDLNARLFAQNQTDPSAKFNSRFPRFVIKDQDQVIWLDANKGLRIDVRVDGIISQSECELMGAFGGWQTWVLAKGTKFYPGVLEASAPLEKALGPWANSSTVTPEVKCTPPWRAVVDFSKTRMTFVATQAGQEVAQLIVGNFEKNYANDYVSNSFILNGKKAPAQIFLRFTE